MTNDSGITRKELLEDLDRSIEKALDAKLNDITGALLRLKASTKGWCEQPDCGKCPLGPLQCITGLDERVQHLIDEHHEIKQAQNLEENKLSQKLKSSKPSKFNLKKSSSEATHSAQKKPITETEMFTE